MPGAIAERREEPIRRERESGLLARLPKDGVEDRLVAVDPAGRQAVGAARIERLDGEEQVARRPANDHADLREP